jgi:hypothetical protein
MIAFPSNLQPFVDAKRNITEVWQLFLAQFVSPPLPPVPLTLTGSPYGFQTGEPGVMVITGGAVSDISIVRGTTTVPTGQTAGSFYLGLQDTIVVTYSVAPDMTFLPA